MKYFSLIVTLALTLSSSVWALSSLPNGQWTGKGTYTTDDGKTGSYSVEVVLQDNQVTHTVVMDGKTYKNVAQITLDANGFGSATTTYTAPDGTVKNGNEQVACGDHHCSFWDSAEHFGTTVSFTDDKAWSFGGVETGNVKVRFEDTLNKVSLIQTEK